MQSENNRLDRAFRSMRRTAVMRAVCLQHVPFEGPGAFATALGGRPGPVLVDIPKDVLAESMVVTGWPQPGRAQPPARPASGDIAQAAAITLRCPPAAELTKVTGPWLRSK